MLCHTLKRMKRGISITIVPMTSRTTEQVLAISAECAQEEESVGPWTAQGLDKAALHVGQKGVVAMAGCGCVGFMLFRYSDSRTYLMDMGVPSLLRRQGIGSQLMDGLKISLSERSRVAIMASVPETNLGMQCFLRSQGFRATRLQTDLDGESASVVFRYRLPVCEAAA